MAQSHRESGGQDIYLSKSLFIRGLQCHKSLHLQKYRPELKEEVSEETQLRFDMGYDVGSLAQQLFPGGVIVPYEGLSHSEQVDMTQSLIERGVDTIYEATFFHDNVLVKADILHHGVRGWEMYEVKASASVKSYHVDDISVQYYVVSGSGLPVARAYLVHINTQYVRQGDVEVAKLFTMVDLTETAKEKGPFIKEELKRQRYMLQEGEPAIDIGPHCDAPFACDFKGHCWSHIPSPSVFDYRDIGKPDALALYRRGIVKMAEVSPDLLGWRQKMQLDGLLHQKNHIDVEAVGTFIESLRYPLAFMDFETTFMIPIPMYNGTRPYQLIPFQFSLHIMDKPDGALSHYEFLADGNDNPQKEFLEKLLAAIPRNACILVWNKNFEKQHLQELAETFPDKRADINVLLENIRDMMVPFRAKSIYHWKFDGSYSIKVVLPALVPELEYDNLEISDGEMASPAWVRLIKSDDEKEKETLRRQILRYCHMDTLAMVRILDKMKEMAPR